MSDTSLTTTPATPSDGFATSTSAAAPAGAQTTTATAAAPTATASAVSTTKNFLSSHRIILSAVAIGLFGFILGRMSKGKASGGNS